MADNVTNELLLETLKAIQSQLCDIASDIVDLKAEMRGTKRKPIDRRPLAEITNRMPTQSVDSAAFVRRMREEGRY